MRRVKLDAEVVWQVVAFEDIVKQLPITVPKHHRMMNHVTGVSLISGKVEDEQRHRPR